MTQNCDRTHIVKVRSADMVRLRDWLDRPNGSLSLGAVTFESVEDGGIWVRTRSWESGDPR